MSAETFKRCSICREFGWFPQHKCAPIWEARIYEPGHNEDWSEVHAYDAESAACKFAEKYDQEGEYGIVSSGSAEIEVRKPGKEEITLFDISAESVPRYTADARISP